LRQARLIPARLEVRVPKTVASAPGTWFLQVSSECACFAK
jgi:hypothetical protein